MTGCPYKKVYFNWKTNKAEKCTFCYPRVEAGLPTVCSETCTGRMRYLGVMLYDADRVLEAASVEDEQALYEAQLDLFLDPNDPEVIEQAERDGISADWIEAAQSSPVYKLAVEYKLAFPLHPEYRTMPIVWYCPPLSPIMNYFEGKDSIKNPDAIFPAIEEMRIPLQYLANMLTAGDVEPVKGALQKMAMMRQYMRAISSGKDFDETRLERVGMNANVTKSLYRLLAIAKYEDRFVIPSSHREQYADPYRSQGSSGFGFGGSDCDGCGPSLAQASVAKSGKEVYEENFYGGIWRD
jgi:nitrate reductase beta subunit